jgi:23S rRNA-/tRNA-specific pseudouridylate synthase
MKYIDCPVIGDSKYSTNEINAKFKLYTQVLYASKYTFSLPKESSLYYLNNITIDIKDNVLEKIHGLLKH